LILFRVEISFCVNTAGIEEQGEGSGPSQPQGKFTVDGEETNSKVPAIFKFLNPLIA
jgi:hypothetical protein